MRCRLGLAAISIAAVAAAITWYALRERPIDNLFGGSANADIVALPTQVEAFRLGLLPRDSYLQDLSPEDYPVIRGPVILSDAIAAEVSNTLLSPNSYLWDAAKACIPMYGVKLSFVRGDDRVDVLLCFECDILCISRDGRAIGYADFENSREVFVRAAKQAFPDDEIIKKLKP